MTPRVAARLWWILGGLALAVLWIGVVFDATWLRWAGLGFLAVPFVAAVAMTLPNTAADRTSSLCALGMFLLFCLTWIF